jgi:hypothetical protein
MWDYCRKRGVPRHKLALKKSRERGYCAKHDPEGRVYIPTSEDDALAFGVTIVRGRYHKGQNE